VILFCPYTPKLAMEEILLIRFQLFYYKRGYSVTEISYIPSAMIVFQKKYMFSVQQIPIYRGKCCQCLANTIENMFNKENM